MQQPGILIYDARAVVRACRMGMRQMGWMEGKSPEACIKTQSLVRLVRSLAAAIRVNISRRVPPEYLNFHGGSRRLVKYCAKNN